MYFLKKMIYHSKYFMFYRLLILFLFYIVKFYKFNYLMNYSKILNFFFHI